ncbi:unnamed protein product, partial [Brassica oleracea]
DDEEKRGVNLFFYIADESGKVLNLGLQGSSTLVCGSREVDVGNWQLHLKSETPGLVSHYCGFKTANSVNLSDLVQKNLTVSDILNFAVKLSDTAEDDSNVYVFQISTMSQFSTIDIAFISGIDEKTADMEDRTNTLTGSQLTTLLAEKHVAFDEKFRECFNLSEEYVYLITRVSNCSKIKHDHVQYPDVVNPPTLLLVLCGNKFFLYEKKFNDEESAEIVSFLEAWFQWLYTSQKGKKEGSFYWRGRDSTTVQHSCNTVASGMDDYPWASHPSDDEMHVDLRCWIYLAADCMKFITTFLQRKKNDYSSIVHQLSDFDDLNKMHYDRDHKTYLDFGNHAEKVRLVIDVGRGIRVTNEEPELKKVPHVGYASLFPFMSKIIPPHSEILEQQLDLISSNELVCSDYGLLSLAKTSSSYMTPNSLMNQPPCWRGPIWMNINYMILASLKHYSSVEGPYSDKARDIYVKLRNNLISNVVGEYDKTRYIWERYDQTKGTGEGGRNFTGWSALILLIMTEDYPRLQKRSWLSNPAHVSEIK